jgi:hypothetical protein
MRHGRALMPSQARIVKMLVLCALMPALANHAEHGAAQGAGGTGPGRKAPVSEKPLGAQACWFALVPAAPLRLSLSGGAPPGDDAGDDIKQIRSMLEEMKRRRRTASPTSARGRPAFNATADREMRARKIIEELRIKRHERFDQVRDGPSHARSRSAPSPNRPWPETRAQTSGGIAQFAGSGGWGLNSTVSSRIWATEATVGTGDNGTANFLNWSSLVSAASIKTSASSDVLFHMRGGSDIKCGGSSEGDSSELVSVPSEDDAQADGRGGDSGLERRYDEDTLDEEDEDGGDDSDDSAREQEARDAAGRPAELDVEMLSEDPDPSDRAEAEEQAVASKKRGNRSSSRQAADAKHATLETNPLEEREFSSVSAADSESPAQAEWAAASAAAAAESTTPGKMTLLKAARRGDRDAQLKVGLRFISGPAAKRNPARGLMWLKKAARAGCGRAAFNVAGVYSAKAASGAQLKRVAHNDTHAEALAVHFLRRAARLKYPPALYHLGARYLKGAGVEHKEERAMHLWRLAG